MKGNVLMTQSITEQCDVYFERISQAVSFDPTLFPDMEARAVKWANYISGPRGGAPRHPDPVGILEMCEDILDGAGTKPMLTLMFSIARQHGLPERIVELLTYNNQQVEKRRFACALLREAAEQFRTYELSHLAKTQPVHGVEPPKDAVADAIAKAERNAAFASRIETFLQEIHQ